MKSKSDDSGMYFVLASWCTATRAWQQIPGRYKSVQDAERSVTERGIYRVTCVCDERRCDLEPFARVGED